MKCPYYNEHGHECKLYETKQSDYQRDAYCKSSDNWKRCANYEEAKKTNSPRL